MFLLNLVEEAELSIKLVKLCSWFPKEPSRPSCGCGRFPLGRFTEISALAARLALTRANQHVLEPEAVTWPSENFHRDL